VDTDKYTASVEMGQNDGYFIRTLPGVKTTMPVQACLYLSKPKFAQKCAQYHHRRGKFRIAYITAAPLPWAMNRACTSVSPNLYIKKGAKVTFTMIHSWNRESPVRPRTAAIIEEDGLFLSNYVLMKPVNTIQMNPIARCNGKMPRAF